MLRILLSTSALAAVLMVCPVGQLQRPAPVPTLAKRQVFYEKLTRIRKGMELEEVTRILGATEDVRQVKGEHEYDIDAAIALCFGAKTLDSLPLLGQVLMSDKGRVVFVVGAAYAPTAPVSMTEAELSEALLLLHSYKLPWKWGDERPLLALRISQRLVSLKKDGALRLLREYSRVAPSTVYPLQSHGLASILRFTYNFRGLPREKGAERLLGLYDSIVSQKEMGRGLLCDIGGFPIVVAKDDVNSIRWPSLLEEHIDLIECGVPFARRAKQSENPSDLLAECELTLRRYGMKPLDSRSVLVPFQLLQVILDQPDSESPTFGYDELSRIGDECVRLYQMVVSTKRRSVWSHDAGKYVRVEKPGIRTP